MVKCVTHDYSLIYWDTNATVVFNLTTLRRQKIRDMIRSALRVLSSIYPAKELLWIEGSIARIKKHGIGCGGRNVVVELASFRRRKTRIRRASVARIVSTDRLTDQLDRRRLSRHPARVKREYSKRRPSQCFLRPTTVITLGNGISIVQCVESFTGRGHREYTYRARNKGLQNIANQDPGSARQSS